MANTNIGGRSIFSTRKVRKNAGTKRGPRVAPRVAPTNVIVVNSGGMATVVSEKAPRKRMIGPRRQRKNVAAKAAAAAAFNALNMYTPNGGFVPGGGGKKYGPRRQRKNAGVKRGPKYLPRNANLFA